MRIIRFRMKWRGKWEGILQIRWRRLISFIRKWMKYIIGQLPPQTVNSALKGLERQGIIVLTPIPGNQKNKRIGLTEKGEEMTRQIIYPLILAEQRTFQGLSEEERKALLSLTKKYVGLLQSEIQKI